MADCKNMLVWCFGRTGNSFYHGYNLGQMNNKEKLASLIKDFLIENTFLDDEDLYSPKITFGIVKEYPTPSHEDCCEKLASEVAEFILNKK